MTKISVRARMAATATTALFALSGCVAEPGAPTPWTPQGDHSVWAVGDSQAANAGDPRRGPGWGERLGLGDGARSMHGAGWIRPGTLSAQSIAGRMLDVAHVDGAEGIVVMAGVNDLGGSTNTTIQSTILSVDQATEALGVAVVYVSIPPFPVAATANAHNAQRIQLNEFLGESFPERSIDCESALVNESGHLRPEFAMDPDDLHLNDAGEQALADCIEASPAFAQLNAR